jgi:hypothetical protein
MPAPIAPAPMTPTEVIRIATPNRKCDAGGGVASAAVAGLGPLMECSGRHWLAVEHNPTLGG